MMEKIKSKKLNMFQSLFENFSIVIDKKSDYLDLMNFNKNRYRKVLDICEVEKIFNPEHGYSSPDSLYELGALIKNLELKRVDIFNKSNKSNINNKNNFNDVGVGVGHGTTGVVNCLFPSIIDFKKKESNINNPEIIISVPNYPMFDALATAHDAKPVYLHTKSKNKFLPNLSELKQKISKKTIAVVITYPNNPCQTTYNTNDEIKQLKEMVDYCISKKIFFIADNIYQDTIWSGKINPEILSLVNNTEYVVKLFGPSKDRPHFSGLRVGYWIGDKRLQEDFCKYSALSINSMNTQAKCMIALELLFRTKILDNSKLSKQDMSVLNNFLVGWKKKFNHKKCYSEICKLKIFEKYKDNLVYNNKAMALSLKKILEYLNKSDYFSEVINDNCGNTIFIKVNKKYFIGSSQKFFKKVLDNCKLGIMPGNCFGIRNSGEAWFRITTIQENYYKIIKKIKVVEKMLKDRA